MRSVIDKMGLATECIVISLIYLDMLMTCTKIEIRYINWRPLLFTSILLASKFWEDINFWNVDYEEHLEMYDLKAINRMESQFLSLCEYKIYVSLECYSDYLNKVR
jgi:Cyclin